MKKESFKKVFVNLKSGFTYVELLTAILITGVVASFILTGMVNAKTALYKLRVKEQAFDTLKGYTDFWKGRIASNEIPSITTNCINYSNNNLHNDFYCLDKDMDDKCIVEAEACYDIKIAQTGVSSAKRADLTTEIRWEDAYSNKDTLYFYVTQIIY